MERCCNSSNVYVLGIPTVFVCIVHEPMARGKSGRMFFLSNDDYDMIKFSVEAKRIGPIALI